MEKHRNFLLTDVHIVAQQKNQGFYRMGYMCITNTVDDNRRIVVETHFYDDHCVQSQTASMPELNQRIQKVLGYPEPRSNASGFACHIGKLRPNEEFCNGALRLAREIFKALGVNNPNNAILTEFALCQETYVKHKSEWIRFQDLLRIRHKLPGHHHNHEPWPG